MSNFNIEIYSYFLQKTNLSVDIETLQTTQQTYFFIESKIHWKVENEK